MGFGYESDDLGYEWGYLEGGESVSIPAEYSSQQDSFPQISYECQQAVCRPGDT
ncbi:MAG: hypothetical protein U1F57_02460 [bacterium]